MSKFSNKVWEIIKSAKNSALAEWWIKKLVKMSDDYRLPITDIQIAKWYIRNQDDPDIMDSALRSAARLFPHNEKLVKYVAVFTAPIYQVNHKITVDDVNKYNIQEHKEWCYKGWLVEQAYECGADQVNYAEFVGTYDECLEYIEQEEKRIFE